MPTMGRYCKAYPMTMLRRYPQWQENLDNLRTDRDFPDGVKTLNDGDYLYLQEDLSVTDGIFRDEHVIYTADDPDWRAFCEQDLQFKVPD